MANTCTATEAGVSCMKPIFIALLEHGEKHELEGSNLTKMLAWASAEGYLPPENDFKHTTIKGFLRDLFFKCFEQNSLINNNTWCLKPEYYFRLLEYRELVEARTASSEANRNAIWAIRIAIMALIASFLVGFFQVFSPVKISDKQLRIAIDELEAIDKRIEATQIEDIRYSKDQLKALKDIKSAVDLLRTQVEATNKALNSQAQPAGTPINGAP